MNLMTYYKQYNIPEQSTIYSLFEEKAEENKLERENGSAER